MKHLQFSCSLWDEATPLPHFWEHTVGSATRLWRCAVTGSNSCAKLAFRHTRLHGLLCDQMGPGI